MGVLEALAATCPTHGARAAVDDDAVDGVAAAYVARPARTEEVAACLQEAARHDLRLVARGAGTKLDWGLPPRAVDLVVDLSAMDALLEHARGDLVLRARAGARLATLQERLAEHGQWLPLDEVVPGSTLGGVVATALSGPSRHRHGGVRDLLIGVTLVRPDGVVARAGGKVVKNVAGYDLCKLLTGSYGSLAVCTELTFRLRPRALARRFLRLAVDGGGLPDVLRELRRAPEAPSAVELAGGATGPFELAVLLEGRPGALEARAAALAGRLGADDGGESAPEGFGTLPGAVTVKATSGPGAVPALLRLVGEVAASEDLEPTVRALPGVGVSYVGLPERVPPAAVAGLLDALRRRPAAQGTAIVLRAPRPLRLAVDCWGPVAGLGLMRRLKDQFDPDARLAPGRFVGGI